MLDSCFYVLWVQRRILLTNGSDIVMRFVEVPYGRGGYTRAGNHPFPTHETTLALNMPYLIRPTLLYSLDAPAYVVDHLFHGHRQGDLAGTRGVHKQLQRGLIIDDASVQDMERQCC